MSESAEETQSGQSEEEEEEQDQESEEQEDDKDPAEELLLSHLMDVHALEEEASKLLDGAIDLSKDDELEKLFKNHHERTREHEELVTERIQAHDDQPEAIKDLTMQAAASVGLRYLNEEPPDTPVKLAMHVFCFESLKVSAYEFLRRFADAAGDSDTVDAAQKMLDAQREMVDELSASFDQFVELLGEYRGRDDEDDEEEDEDGSGADDGNEDEDES